MGPRPDARPAPAHHDRTGAPLSDAADRGWEDRGAEAPGRGAEAPRYGRLASALAIGLSLYALCWVLFIIQPQVYRVSFLLIALVLTFLSYPARRARGAGQATDWLLIAAAVAAFAWPLVDFQQFVYRAAEPGALDLTLGSIAILLVLEATRRSVGWILPGTAALFLVYAWAGPLFDRLGLPVGAGSMSGSSDAPSSL